MAKLRFRTDERVSELVVPTKGGLFVAAIKAYDDGTTILNYILGTSAVSLADILETCGMGRQLPENVAAIMILLPSNASNRVFVGRGSGMVTGSANSGSGSISIGAGESITTLVIDEDTEEWEDSLYLAASGASTDIKVILGEVPVYE